MSERFERIFSLTGNLYTESAPLIISAGALLKDTETGKILAQLKFKSISPEPIKAIKVKITPMDTIGKPIGDEVFFDYLDLNEKRDSEFGQKKPIPMPNPATRSFMAEVTEVAFTNNSVWVASENAWNSLDALVSLEQALGNHEVVKQYRMRFGHKAAFQPHHSKDIWFCTCGAVNHDDEKGCHVCGNDENTLFSCDNNKLKSDAARRIEQEAAAKIEQTKKRNKTLVLVASILVICIATVFLITKIVIPNSKYNQAVALFDEGRYDEAITAFTELNGYKDSAEKIEAVKQAKIDAANKEEYTKAEQLLANGQYSSAIDTFQKLGNYQDSAQRVLDAQEEAYLSAVSLFDAGEYDVAIALFSQVSNYKDSAKMITESENAIKYAEITALIEEEEFYSAYSMLEDFHYRDSDKLREYISQQPKYLMQVLNHAVIGDTVFFGSYEQDNRQNGAEKIEWIVLDKKGDALLLVSKYVLDCQPYNETREKGVTWETSTLRAWLNSSFLSGAFTEEEQEQINDTIVSAEAAPGSAISQGRATIDKVFLLSYAEYKKYPVYIGIATPYVISKEGDGLAYGYGAGSSDEPQYTWWFRTVSHDDYYFGTHVYCLAVSGVVFDSGSLADRVLGVRPALWINLSSD